MLPVLTAAQMAGLDRYTIETLGLDGKLLMSSAAREVLRIVLQRYPSAHRLLIFAGTGNNGGDGVALSYYAQQAGLNPLLVLCHPEINGPPELSEDSQYFFRIAQRAYVPVQLLPNPALVPEIITTADADVLVDALFGTGLDRPLGEYWLAIIDRLNQSSRPIVAVDAPSGLNCATGEVMGGAVAASCTITMGYPKLGFYHPAAVTCIGEVYVAQLGFGALAEAGITPEAYAWPDALWGPLAAPRLPVTHKGHYGRLLIVAGHQRYPGAPRLAAVAALRAGAGLVRLVVPEPVYAAACADPAVMVEPHTTDGQGGFAAEPDPALLEHLNWADALVLGPGLSTNPAGLELAQRLAKLCQVPAVIDADGLRALPVAREPGRWPLVLTPHIGELARLAGVIPDVAWERLFEITAGAARANHAFVLAKSNQCVLATPEGQFYFPRAGHPALASGGTGDVLSGITSALLARLHAQERDLEARLAHTDVVLRQQMVEVIVTAVNIHATAGCLGAEALGEDSLTASGLLDFIGPAMAYLRRSR